MATEIPPIYRFTLSDRTTTGTWTAHPVYKDDLALEYAREQGQQFFRTKMSGKLNFVGADALWIIGRGYSHEIGVLLERSNDMGGTYTTAWTGHFFMTDCEVSLDDSRVTVQPTVDDDYNKILAGMEKEFNLVELLPDIFFVRMKKFPLIQIYYPAETTLSCIYNGMSWEQDVDSETSDEVLTDEYHFFRNSDTREITLKQNGVVYGIYQADVDVPPGESYDADFLPVSGGAGTKIHLVYTQTAFYSIWIQLLDSSDNVLYEYEDQGAGNLDTSVLTFTMENEQGATMDGKILSRAIYSRILLDVEEFDGQETAPLSSSDFCHDNRNYTRAIGFVLADRYLMTSTQTQVDPTEWGKASNGRYFVEPTASDDVFPIARTSWDSTSVWFVNDGNIISYIRSYGQERLVLRTAYPLTSVISVLLGQIDSAVSHEALPAYSHFLYDVNNPVYTSMINRTLLITPKSNLIAGEFSQPASNAPITLKNVFDMLRDVFQCYWRLSRDNNGIKLVIEHISYYKNGGSYSQSPAVGFDTTAMLSRNGEPWAFGTSVYKYDKEQMPQTYQFGWMDDCTEPFMGKSIEVISPYVEQGQIEETRVSMFTSDVDYILLNPQAISKDGFALMAGTPDNGDYRLSEGSLSAGSFPWQEHTLYLQNWELAYCYLQYRFWRSDLPARSVKINGQTTTATGVRRTKRQEIRFPVYGDPDPMQLVKTFLGNGNIEKMTLTLSSRIAKTVLKYDPE